MKPSKEVLLLWIKDALQRLEFQDGVFERTILRDPQGLKQPSSNQEEEESLGDYELMLDEDYVFSDLE